MTVGSHVCESVTTVLEKTSKKAKVENRDRKLPTIGSSLRFSNPEQFWKTINQALDEFSEPGSVPHNIVRKVVRQVTECSEAENPTPSMKTVEWVAWSFCMKFPGLK